MNVECWSAFIDRSDIYVEADTRVGTVNATTGVYVAARINKGGCNSVVSEGIFYFLFPAEGMLQVTGDLGKIFAISNLLFISVLLCMHLLACLFQGKSQTIIMARSSSLMLLSLFLSSCKNFNIAHYWISIKGINTKLGILAYHDKLQLQDKGHNPESYIIFRVMPLFN